MIKRKRWTTEDDEIVIQAVKDNFDNLSKGFREAAAKLNRTYNAVITRWYHVLSNPESKGYMGNSCFIGFSAEKRYINRKVHIEGFTKQEPIKSATSVWKKILKLLKLN